jgi:Lon protease-like protein
VSPDAFQGASRQRLPLFPLHTVLLPGVHLPLHIFEPRYRQLTMDLMDETVPQRRFGVIAIRDSLVTDVDSADQLHPIGCSALLREASRLPEGRFDIVTTGQDRFRLLDLEQDEAPYLVGTVEWIPDDAVADAGRESDEALAAAARQSH